jgi:hypothetical protein
MPIPGFPEEMIVFDREFTRAPFYLRKQVAEAVELIELDGAMSLPAAKQIAEDKGYAPTHWIERGHREPVKF